MENKLVVTIEIEDSEKLRELGPITNIITSSIIASLKTNLKEILSSPGTVIEYIVK